MAEGVPRCQAMPRGASQAVLAHLGLEHPFEDPLAVGEIFHRFKAAHERGLGEGDLELPIARFRTGDGGSKPPANLIAQLEQALDLGLLETPVPIGARLSRRLAPWPTER